MASRTARSSSTTNTADRDRGSCCTSSGAGERGLASRRWAVFEGLGAKSVLALNQEKYCVHHFIPHEPGESSTKAHRNAELQFAIWNRSHGISAMPATIGTLARNGPEKRAMMIPHAPQRLKSTRPLSKSFGWFFSGTSVGSARGSGSRPNMRASRQAQPQSLRRRRWSRR